MEVPHHVRLYPVEPGPGLGNPPSRHAERDIFGAFNPVVAPGNLPFEHPHELAPDAVKIVRLGGDVHLIAAGGVGAAVDKGELDGEGAVEVVEERAPPAENRGLILSGCHGIVDVLIFHGLCVEPAGELAHAVRVHRHIGDGLLGGQRRPAFSPSWAALVVYAFHSVPPFPPRPAR